MTADTRLLFCYGAMMSPSVLSKRGVNPKHTALARVLSDDLAVSFSHRAAYATLTYNDPHDLPGHAESALCRTRPFGLVLELADDELARVAEKEVGYRLSHVAVERLDVDPPRELLVEAFVSNWGMELLDGPLPPTARYKKVIEEGVDVLERQGVDKFEGGTAYVAWVRSLPTVDVASHPAYSRTGVALATNAGFAVAGAALLYSHLFLH